MDIAAAEKRVDAVPEAALLSRRLLIVSGKGGVGKSTVSAALALLASRQGKRVVVVEIDTVPTVAELLGSPEEMDYTPREVAPGISVMNIDGFAAIEDYLTGKLKSRLLLDKLFQSRMYRYFLAAAPGLKELMTVGKLWDLVDNQPDKDGRPKYDLVLADMPATGHGFSHLRMPQTAVDTLKIGFVKEEAAKILRLFRDPDRTAFVIVTLAEEMPANEAVEMRRLVREQLGFRVGCLVVNGVYPELMNQRAQEEAHGKRLEELMSELREDRKWRPLLESSLSVQKRRAMNRRYVERLRSDFSEPVILLPFLFTRSLNAEALQGLSRTLGQALSSRTEEGAVRG
jgi:anion-transporting  ArsA/GET3 family ATPase